MKGLIETSFYLLLLTIISYVCIDYIAMNMRINRYSEVKRYVSDYMEIYGEVSDGQLADNVITELENIEKREEIRINHSCILSTDRYAYYKLDFTYKVCSNILAISKEHTSTQYVKVSICN